MEAICGKHRSACRSASASKRCNSHYVRGPDFRRRRLHGNAEHRKVSVGHDVRGRGDGEKDPSSARGETLFRFRERQRYALGCSAARRLRFTRRIGIPVDRCPAVWPELNSGTSGGQADIGRVGAVRWTFRLPAVTRQSIQPDPVISCTLDCGYLQSALCGETCLTWLGILT